MKKLDIVEGSALEFGDLNDLEHFRFSNGKGFPVSYKDFVTTYGYGLTGATFIIYIPMGDYGDSWHIRSEEIKATYEDALSEDSIWFDVSPELSIEKIKKFVPFAASENGEYLFWDVTDTAGDEFDIYVTDFKGVPFTKVAESLGDLISTVTNVNEFKRVLPFAEESLPPVFKPWRKK